MARTQKKPASATAEQRTRILRVAGYLRVSTEEQARSGLGLAAQEAQIRAMATVKGWPEPVIYRDEGVSGTLDWRKRTHLNQLMTAAQTGEIDAVIVSATDRLARNTRVTLDIVDTLRRAGVILVSCKESLDTTTSQGQFFVTIIAGWAQLERDQISERTIAALGQVRLRTGDTGGHLPYGYVRADGYIAVHLAQARIVRRIFLLRAQGASLRAIAAVLNQRRYDSPQGRRWHHSSVQAVLANAHYYRGAQIGASDRSWPVILEDGSDIA